ncbi:Crp/Fnr family transcriptional regulator [Phenylobacterium sp.]|uniref:Crp/Fnr family transcriptional regulator n=1 Tax=Phenylobacterium sp. TaxID=1871053 RepID=UPI0025EF026F|nr:Crp/Fnr family transcriptional regulator [Phenylobacterium sp.]MBX3482241.1 Crp/Fnr family transcriptional regulator [Phenylobacterium sp.]MCW5758409.1 Crp/Fnr family transcriptional regulator [Phenylobacterium sp.]
MINRRENWIAALPAGIRAELEACAVVRDYPRGAAICEAGDPARGVHQVVEGYIKVTGLTRAGETAVIVVYGPGNCWGESPLIAERPHHHTTTAMTDVRVRHYPRADFLRIYAAHQAVSLALCRKFSRSMSQLIRREAAQSRERMARRVAGCFYAFLHGAPEPAANRGVIEAPLTQTDIADFLGVTRQSVQPEIAALKAAGIVEKRGGVWEVLDVRGLKRWALDLGDA